MFRHFAHARHRSDMSAIPYLCRPNFSRRARRVAEPLSAHCGQGKGGRNEDNKR